MGTKNAWKSPRRAGQFEFGVYGPAVPVKLLGPWAVAVLFGPWALAVQIARLHQAGLDETDADSGARSHPP